MPQSTITQVVDIARQAGRVLMRHYGAHGVAESKADGSPVTVADREASDLIVAALRRLTPGVPVISEEDEIPEFEARRGWDRFWLVDPLDGTKEFIKKNGEFTVNIALIEEGEPTLGVVYAPAQERLYYASRGQGAYREVAGGRPERLVSRLADPLADLRMAVSRTHPSPRTEALVRPYRVVERIIAGSSLKFCRLAEGAADFYPRVSQMKEWDVAAGDCIFRDSAATGRHPSPLKYNKRDLVAGGFVLGLARRMELPRPGVVLFTGLSGAGKSTIAEAVYLELLRRGCPAQALDGDEVRKRFPEIGYARADRIAFLAQVGEWAAELEAQGHVVIASFVSPYREARDKMRAACGRFIEVHVATPLEVCEKRDVKGLYARARRGEIENFTGVSDPYEPPPRAEVVIDTSAGGSPFEAVGEVLERVYA